MTRDDLTFACGPAVADELTKVLRAAQFFHYHVEAEWRFDGLTKRRVGSGALVFHRIPERDRLLKALDYARHCDNTGTRVAMIRLLDSVLFRTDGYRVKARDTEEAKRDALLASLGERATNLSFEDCFKSDVPLYGEAET